jgi:hypothetical protein
MIINFNVIGFNILQIGPQGIHKNILILLNQIGNR